jgi:hypothetical protein
LSKFAAPGEKPQVLLALTTPEITYFQDMI